MTDGERERFDDLLEEVIENVPDAIRSLIQEVPVIVLDQPTIDIMKDLGLNPQNEEELLSICGLHSGASQTEQSVEASGELPPQVHLFRRGIIELAGGWKNDDEEAAIYEEIWVTLLHEIGHQFGLSEEDLEQLGYE